MDDLLRAPTVKTPKFAFPQIQRVILSHFSLYKEEEIIDISISQGVFCLAGANGIGKTTFLTALNFGLTGIVPNPQHAFRSVLGFFNYSKKYSGRYFTGKIVDKDRDISQITIHLTIKEHKYILTRGMFETDRLRELTITDIHSSDPVVQNSTALSSEERLRTYQNQITTDIGLKSFEQFVFLQYFVLTFGESRQLLLWNNNVLTQALSLSFGDDPEVAYKTDALSKELEKEDSAVRNVSTSAYHVTEELRRLQKTIGGQDLSEEDIANFEQEKESLEEAADTCNDNLMRIETEYSDANLKFMESSAAFAAAKNEYEQLYNISVKSSGFNRSHPIIEQSLDKKQCSICGSTHSESIALIKNCIDKHQCPLCGTIHTPSKISDESLDNLRAVDKKIAKAKTEMDNYNAAQIRLNEELHGARKQMSKAKTEIREFESKNEAILTMTDAKSLPGKLASLKERAATLLKQKAQHKRRADEIRKELEAILEDVEQQFSQNEKSFTPIFKNLAELFIGIDLHLRLEKSRTRGKRMLQLSLELAGSFRRDEHQLSESQRFFLDIALRMALAQQMSEDNNTACLFIDTPEGSLDIAYESRAGQMFARFANAGYNVIMTANINTSQLLLKLAADSAHGQMALHDMTTWTVMSDVQQEESLLFSGALKSIRDALEKRE